MLKISVKMYSYHNGGEIGYKLGTPKPKVLEKLTYLFLGVSINVLFYPTKITEQLQEKMFVRYLNENLPTFAIMH